MTISKDLYLAILSMDSYNRGYGEGIGGLGGLGSGIGNATILTDSETVAATKAVAQAAGFYAVAYTFGTGPDVPSELQGKTIISYRGTDFSPAGDLFRDIDHGWALGDGTYAAAQAELATQFLAAVQPDSAPGDILLTGHSLSGGLAGYLSRLYGNAAEVFDPKPTARSTPASQSLVERCAA